MRKTRLLSAFLALALLAPFGGAGRARAQTPPATPAAPVPEKTPVAPPAAIPAPAPPRQTTPAPSKDYSAEELREVDSVEKIGVRYEEAQRAHQHRLKVML